MGNRAVITTAPFKPSNPGIYIHWNGGRASVEGFLKAAKELEYRSPAADPSYSLASLIGVVFTYLGTDGLSVGVGKCSDLDCNNWDNGTYLIGGDWEIVGREHFDGEEEIKPGKTDAIAKCIVAKVKAAAATQIEEKQI